MIESYFPNADDVEEMIRHLGVIATSFRMNKPDVNVSTWGDVQKAIRLGLGETAIPVGTQFTVNHSEYGAHKYAVVAHNRYKNVKNESAPTMTLLCLDLVRTTPFNGRGMFAYVTGNIPAGTYYFTVPTTLERWTQGDYTFTIANNMVKNTILTLEVPVNTALRNAYIYVRDFSTFEIIEICKITSGASGTFMGALGETYGRIQFNHIQRIAYGSNNYKESEVRQFLNSSAEAGEVWSYQTHYDSTPTWLSNVNGFLKGLDPEVSNMIVDVTVPCASNNIYEAPDSTTVKGEKYTVVDKVYLPSINEICGENTEMVQDSTILPYFKNATPEMRIRYYSDTPCRYYTRSAVINNACSVGIIGEDGKPIGRNATDEYYITPMFTIG